MFWNEDDGNEGTNAVIVIVVVWLCGSLCVCESVYKLLRCAQEDKWYAFNIQSCDLAINSVKCNPFHSNISKPFFHMNILSFCSLVGSWKLNGVPRFMKTFQWFADFARVIVLSIGVIESGK